MTSTRIRSRSSCRIATSAVLAALVLLAPSGAGADAEPYRFGPGDVVDVQVWREADLSGPHHIDEAGRLHHVLAGEVEARGLTAPELAEELTRRLEKDYLREARVVVTLSSSARRKAWILGAVAKPGSYPVTDNTRLLDLVFAAGGVRDSATGRAEFYRQEERTEVDLASLLGGDLAANRSVGAGDVLVVQGGDAIAGAQAGAARIRVVGEVARPGTYDLTEAPTVLDAVLVAGGLTDYAAAGRARLIRGAGEERSEQKLDLDDIVHGRAGSLNVALHAGDLIVVPESLF